jgi:DNA modification methylase
MQPHKYAQLFPMACENELTEMAEDIKSRGLINHIILLDDKILDGRNRYEACKRAKVEPLFTPYLGSDPLGDVISWNLHRRHLSTSQRAALAVEMEPMFEEAAKKNMSAGGGDKKTGLPKLAKAISAPVHAREKAASALKISHGIVGSAKEVRAKSPELFEKVKAGEIRVNEAKKEIRKQEQKEKEQEAVKRINVKEKNWEITGDQDVLKCDALITDPPYGILTEDWEPGGSGIEDVTRLWATTWSRCGADFIITFFSQRYMWAGKEWFDESFLGYEFQQLLIWVYKNNKSPQSRMGFKQIWEPIFFYRKKGSQKKIGINGSDWGDDLHDMDAHIAAVPQSNFNDADTKQHPAQKPLSVMRWLVNATTQPGDLIVDPFCGSGTTGIAAIQLKRKFHGIEQDKEFRNLSERRISQYGVV